MSQAQDALRIANSTRMKRAALWRRIEQNPKLALRVLSEPPDYLLTEKVFRVLKALPGFGDVRSSKVLARLNMSPTRQLCDLSDHRRQALVEMLQKVSRRLQ